MKAPPEPRNRRTVVINHSESEADGQKQRGKIVEVKKMPAASGRQGGFNAKPNDKDCCKRAEQGLAHGIEEAEILGEERVDRLKDKLKIVGVHGCGSFD